MATPPGTPTTPTTSAPTWSNPLPPPLGNAKPTGPTSPSTTRRAGPRPRSNRGPADLPGSLWGSHPDTPLVYTYDDRGLLVAAEGGAGETRSTYDTAGRETVRVDQAGAQTITYDANSQIDSITQVGSGTLTPTK
jgi:YD repeat-containing protein